MPKVDLGFAAVVMVGPPGCGKGTVSKHLTSCFSIPHISTGDILREHVQAGDDLGREVKAIMDSGRLVPDELVNRLVEERIGRDDCDRGFILDGYPRTVEQADILFGMLGERGLDPVVVHLDVDYNRIIDRLSARRQCPKCGMVYNLASKPPKNGNLCEDDNCPVIVRDDDREDVIRKRLDAYDTLTSPLVDYFRRRTARFYRVNGNDGSPADVAERACRLIASCE